MAADSNMGFHHDTILTSALNRHVISFQSSAINSTPGLISVGNSFGVNSESGVIFPGSSRVISNTPGITPANSSGGLLESIPELKHDTGFAIDWSAEEQAKLEEGLLRHANEPNIMRYIKIAATLHEKTVRDVALRCRWMTKENAKRRKQEHYMGRKMKDKKDMLLESSLKANTPLVQPLDMSRYPLMMQHMDHNDRISCEAVGGTTRHLLDENANFFCQIATNFTTFKIQDNIDLLCHIRSNITAILNYMRDMPGIMSRMPPLPISIDEELALTILPNKSRVMMNGSPSGIHLKSEPR